MSFKKGQIKEMLQNADEKTIRAANSITATFDALIAEGRTSDAKKFLLHMKKKLSRK